jgi:hypothetical protein
MTKKDFILLAKVIRECPASSNDWVHKPSFVAILASELEKQNHSFEAERFIQACGVEPVSLEEAKREKIGRGGDIDGDVRG